MYSKTDEALAPITRLIVRQFRSLRLLKFDKITSLTPVSTAYQKIIQYTIRQYKNIAESAYEYGVGQAKKNGFKQKKKTDFDEDWILMFLDEPDEVTLYLFMLEIERKVHRLSEALAASKTPLLELDKARRNLALQINHYADKATAEAVVQAYKDCGVKQVMWVTEKDEKVCKTCRPRDGKIYDIDKVPQIPAHYRCRCRLIPVRKRITV